MKKIAILMLLVICAAVSAYAVPRGSYYDSKGRLKVLVDDHGDIHVIDNNGNVMCSMEVIEEKQDGSFTTKTYAVSGQRYNGPTYYNNAYFYDRNGNLCLNLQNYYETVVRE